MRDLLWGRYTVFLFSCIGAMLTLTGALIGWWSILWAIPTTGLAVLGVYDYNQQSRTLLGNYPLLGRFRFFFELIRPELRQYFWESDSEELPYSRNQRAMVYQRAKEILAVRPFGSIESMDERGFSWLNHSMQPTQIKDSNFRVLVGEGPQAYSISVLNISGTSFGALSPNAIQALNTGARLGGFAHNTGEGSLSKYHESGGGDTIWQISTAYFGCRTAQGRFDPEAFRRRATLPQVKMIEIKLSQGAKPGHGGMLLGAKVSKEIAEARGVEIGKDCLSPPFHTEFSTPLDLLDFVQRLRELSGGKPVGIKLCIGHPWEFLSIVKAMLHTGQRIDFITVDGAEGGTGAAPVEFTDHIGSPLKDALVFVDNALRGAGLRHRIRIAASGKIVSAFDILKTCALGADWVNMARPFMFALGCVQARDCASNRCPTGIATMDPKRYRVLNIEDRSNRVFNFHKNTVHAVAEMLEATGLTHPGQMTRRHIVSRSADGEIHLEDRIHPTVREGALLDGLSTGDESIDTFWSQVDGSSFDLKNQMTA